VLQFSENMSSGRGWIAVVAVMLGRAHPAGVLGACLLFATAEGIGFRLQGQGLPSQITDALPFVVTLVALAVARRHFKRVLDLTTSARSRVSESVQVGGAAGEFDDELAASG
jgi:general nucleoside transport system permease protein